MTRVRILFCSHHFFPLVPLAWSFRTDGHEVLLATAEHHGHAAAAGLDVVNVAPDFNPVAVASRVAADEPRFFETVAVRPATDLEEWAVQIAAANRPLFARTMAVVDAWRPDLIVYDQGTTVGLFAAARAGVPAVQRNMSAWRTNGMHRATARYLRDLSRRVLAGPDLVVETFPPSLLAGPAEGWFTRWIPYGGGAVLGERLPRRPARPRIAITMGTHHLQRVGTHVMKPVIATAGEVDADFLLALGDVDVEPLGALPANVYPVGWSPLHALLPTCAAVIHHGGVGTTLTALDAGVPQLAAPHPADQFQHTTVDAIDRRGIGLVATPDDVTPDHIHQLLGDRNIVAATREVRAEIQTLPTPAETARRILATVG